MWLRIISPESNETADTALVVDEEFRAYYYTVTSIDFNGNESDFSNPVTFGIGDEDEDDLSIEEALPEEYSLDTIYPNPFNPITTISFSVPEPSNVTIEVFNLSGRKVSTLVNNAMQPGYHEVSWNADNQISGIYFVKMISSEYINTQKIMLVK